MSTTVTAQFGSPAQFAAFERYARQQLESASLIATTIATRRATMELRQAMRGAGLGRLANAIGSGSDEKKTGRVHRNGERFSASGWIHIRGRSERTRGTIEAYLEGAQISPQRGRWLAFPGPLIPQRAGRRKMTPALYRSTGLEGRIGPLEFVPSGASEALLIVRSVTVDRFGRKGRYARRLPKRGAIGGGREKRDHIVAFFLIRKTARTARVNAQAIIAANVARLPELIGAELRKRR